MTAYGELASLYDRLMENAPYDLWTSFTNEVLKRENQTVRTVIDLGCGTGEITTKLAKQGYQMIGVDYSSDMLTLAEHKAVNQNVSIQWFRQDLRELTGFSNLDLAISYCDVINYITTLKDLENVFKRVAQCLKPGGLFIFDIHSLDHVQHQMVDHTFSEVEEDFSYIWDCEEGEEQGEMFHHLTFFTLEKDGKYRRFDEFHHQHTYAVEQYKQLLLKADFENIQIHYDFNFKNEKQPDRTERIFIIAEKRSRL